MWLTNGGSSTLVAVLVRTDEGADKPHRNLTAFLVEKPSASARCFRADHPRQDRQNRLQGHRHHRAALFDGYRADADDVLGRHAGQGFVQMMDGVEVGRVNVAARACGVGIRAFELAVALRPAAQHVRQADRRASGDRLPARRDGHQGRGRASDDGQRRPAEGLRRTQRRRCRNGEILASEFCAEVTQQSFRIHGGYGYSKEYEIERLMRDAPFLLIGEGTSEIQKTIISKGLLREYRA